MIGCRELRQPFFFYSSQANALFWRDWAWMKWFCVLTPINYWWLGVETDFGNSTPRYFGSIGRGEVDMWFDAQKLGQAWASGSKNLF
jgi:hypothetical protein